jgi:PcfJ-like protein
MILPSVVSSFNQISHSSQPRNLKQTYFGKIVFLLELFVAALKNRESPEKNQSELNSTIVEVLQEIEGQFNSEQLEKIEHCCEQVLLPPHETRGEREFSDIQNGSLSLELALRFVLLDGANRSTTLTEDCLKFLSETTKQIVYLDENGTIHLDISKPNNETDKIIELISALEGEVTIDLAPLEKINELIRRYGAVADSLFLSNCINDDQHFEEIVEKCPKIKEIIVHSDKINKMEALSQLPNLTTLNCRGCIALKELPELPYLTSLDCGGCKVLKELLELPHLTSLNCRGCIALEELPELPHLTSLNCRGCIALEELPELPHLTSLDCQQCDALEELPELPNLTSLKGVRFSQNSLFSILLNIFVVDQQHCLKVGSDIMVENRKLQTLLIDYFNCDEMRTLKKRGEEVEVTKGELRKTAFGEFPFLFDFLSHDILSRDLLSNEQVIPFPEILQSEIDNGNIWNALKVYYGINPTILQKIPFSHNKSMPSPLIIQMLQAGVLKAEWLPDLPKRSNLQSIWEQSRDMPYQNFRKEQQAFCDVILGCLRLSKELRLRFDIQNPESYPEFLVELIKNTALMSKKSWRDKASALPLQLRSNYRQRSNIKDAVDDFIKTVFLPYYIQSHLSEYEPGSAQRLFNQLYLDIVTKFLKGGSIGAISELSSRWHEPGRMAQLSKAKTFSNNVWEPLFTSPISYECEEGTITLVPLCNPQELKKEGRDLDHCVGGYTNKCLQENSHIVSLRDETGKSLSTLEFTLDSGRGRDDDPKIINIDGENHYHLTRVQHYGSGNSSPSPICEDVERRFYNDLQKKLLKVNLPGLERKREERVRILKEKVDVSLIGYDPREEKSFINAKKIYKEHGIGNISQAGMLRSNFDSLTGVERQMVSRSKPIKSKKNANEVNGNIQFIQQFFDYHLQEGIVQVTVEHSQNKPHGRVVITLSEESSISVDVLKETMAEIFQNFQKKIISWDKSVSIEGLTPRNFANILRQDSMS